MLIFIQEKSLWARNTKGFFTTVNHNSNILIVYETTKGKDIKKARCWRI